MPQKDGPALVELIALLAGQIAALDGEDGQGTWTPAMVQDMLARERMLLRLVRMLETETRQGGPLFGLMRSRVKSLLREVLTQA